MIKRYDIYGPDGAHEHESPDGDYVRFEDIRVEGHVQLTQVLAIASLVDKIARLNPDAGEIGAGMLATLVSEARRIQGVTKPEAVPETVKISREAYEETIATMTKAREVLRTVFGMGRKVGPIYSHANGAAWGISNALQLLQPSAEREPLKLFDAIHNKGN